MADVLLPQIDGVEATVAPRRGRPPQDSRVQRRRILEAASEIIHAQGFAGSSLDAIASAAGVTKRTIYALIGDKAAVFKAVCTESVASVASIPFPSARPGDILEETLTYLASVLMEHALSPQLVALSRVIMLESQRFPDLAQSILESGRETMHAGIKSVFVQLQAQGVAHFEDLEGGAEAFYDVVVGNRGFRATIGFHEPFPSEADIRRRVAIFTRGYF